MDDAEVARGWQEFLDQACRDLSVPGIAAAIVYRDRAVWTAGAGWADRASGRLADANTLFRAGSITKLLTATAVMTLRDRGRLSLDDPVAAHLPEFTLPGVTVRHLLCHGAGLPRESPDEAGWRTRAFSSDKDVLASLPRARGLYPPMERGKYSNLGYTLLGLVVERVSGAPYRRFVGERVLSPLSMADTTFDPEGMPAERRATGYMRVPGEDAAAPDERAWEPISTAAAGAATTVADLARFASFLLGHGPPEAPISPATLEEMRRPRLIADRNWTIAHGFGPMLVRKDSRILVGHAGAMFSFAGWLLVAPEEEIGSVCLVNEGDERPAFALAIRLVDAAAGWAASSAEAALRPPSAAADLLGRYVGDRGLVLSIASQAGRLVASWEDRPGLPSSPEAQIEILGDGSLRFAEGPYLGEGIHVERGANGEVRGFEVCTYWFSRLEEAE
jgi:CubicO group peptidase (beta-lactamase class C family)